MADYSSYLVTRLYMEGAHVGYSFPDASPQNKTFVSGGGAHTSNLQAYEGVTSARFQGGDYIYDDATPKDADFYFADQPWTVDLRVYPQFVNATRWLCYYRNGRLAANVQSSWQITVVDGELVITVYEGTNAHTVTCGLLVTNTWQRVSVNRDGTTLRAFIDEIQVGTLDLTGITLNDPSTCYFQIGYDWNGYIDNFDVYKGVALFDENFADPNEPAAPAPVNVAGRSVQWLGDITDGVTITRLPISSWQAVLRTSEQSYGQVVIPAATDVADAIGGATNFSISYRVLERDGTIAAEAEFQSFPIEAVRFDRGPYRKTCTLSGYKTGYTPIAHPDESTDKVLSGIRYISSYSTGQRTRASIDLALTPQQRLTIENDRIIVNSITYSVSLSDAWMEVTGSRERFSAASSLDACVIVSDSLFAVAGAAISAPLSATASLDADITVL